MRKTYFTLLLLAISISISAQDAFWTVTNYRGAFPVTDGTPATDWTSGWTNFDANNTIYPATVTTVSTDVLTNTTWSGVVLLQNKIYVKNNATLTILPGTIIRGDKLTQATLIVTRGAKIYANGTALNPVIFTSNVAPGSRLPGDWGGLVILGLAKNNQPGGVANIEGIVPTTDTQFGGSFDNDNSGSLTYVRIEYAGIALEPNKEVNGLTCGSVGSGTVIDYIQVSSSGDDSFEWFGGTVNCKHLIAYRGLDDDFDTDFGYRGKVQFGLAIRDKDLSDAIGDSNCFESDNDAAGSTAQPKTKAIFSNITIVGPKGNGSVVLPVGEKFEKAFRLRRNTAVSCLNSLVTGWEKGISIESSSTVANVNGDTLIFATNSMSNLTNGTNVITSSGVSGAFYTSFYGVDGNDSTITLPFVNWVNIFTALGTTPDARLNAGSSVSTTASFTHPKFFSIVAPVVVNSVTYCQNATASAINGTPLFGNTLYYYTTAVGGIGSVTPIIPSTTTAGVFTFYVSQKNTAGDESPRAMVVVTINPSPVVSAGLNQTVCAGTAVTLIGSGANTYTWNNGVSNGVSFIPNTTTNYTVTGIASNGCSSNSQTTVTVNALPILNVGATQTVCAGTAVTLTATGASTYVWNNNVTNGISFTPTATTTFIVTGTNLNGCTATDQTQVIVNALPILSVNTNQTVCAGTAIVLNASGALNYAWSNGAINGVSFIPTSTTSYSVTGTGINGCSSNAQVIITVNVLPTINAGSNQTVCAGTSVTLNASGASTYSWNNGVNNGVSFIPTATNTYAVTGTDLNGCTNSAQVNVNVNPLPSLPVITSNGPTSFCTGSSVILTSSYPSAIVWSTGQTTPTILVTNSGSFTVSYTNANGCSSTSSPTSVNVSNAPLPTIQATSLQACTGDLVTVNASLSDTYLWSTGQTTQAISVSSTTLGLTVTTTNLNACAGVGTSTPININFTTALPTISASSLTACTGDTIVLSSSLANSYLWSSGQITQTINVTSTSITTVTTTNSNACNGVGTSASVSVTFTNTPPTITASSLTACSGDTIMLSSSLADSYTWSNGQTTQSIYVTSTSSPTVFTTNNNACNGYGLSQATTVTFTATPSAAGAYTFSGNVVTFTNTSMGASAYSWDFGDQSSSSAMAPSHAYIGNGVYTVTLTAINGNCTDAVSFDVTISVGVDELTGLSNVVIYPNPANDVINIDFNNNGNQQVELTLIDQFGRIVKDINGNSGGFNHSTINVSDLNSGVYYIKFSVGGYTKSERVVIK